MTAFESYFAALKKALNRSDIYDIWPDFEPKYDEKEYTWTTLRGMGEVLILNCGRCDGPSDLRHSKCKRCIERRGEIAKKVSEKSTGRPKPKWPTIMLCRIFAE